VPKSIISKLFLLLILLPAGITALAAAASAAPSLTSLDLSGCPERLVRPAFAGLVNMQASQGAGRRLLGRGRGASSRGGGLFKGQEEVSVAGLEQSRLQTVTCTASDGSYELVNVLS
jgi:hypothetical protein